MVTRPVIDSALTGTPLKTLSTFVSWRDTMNYSAALGDANPRYFDDESPEGITAHPVFPVAVTWKILGRIGEFIDSKNFPLELLLTQVHYTEHLEIHRPLVPGSRVDIEGRIAAILPHRAGTHVILRLDAADGNGLALFTEHIGAMLRGVECGGVGSGGEDIPSVPGLSEPGEPLWERVLHVDLLRPFVYDGCTDIVFPIHTSKQFARQVGLPGIILQGTATLAMAVTEIINGELGADPRTVRSIACRFSGMVLPGSDISVRLLGKEKSRKGTGLFFDVRDGTNQPVLLGGYLYAE